MRRRPWVPQLAVFRPGKPDESPLMRMRPRRAVPSLRNLAQPVHAGAQQRLGDAVHNQVRIPPDRRSEVRIRRRSQRKVSLVYLASSAPASASAASGSSESALPACLQSSPPASDTSSASRQYLPAPHARAHCRPRRAHPRRSPRVCMRFTGSAPSPSEYPKLAASSSNCTTLRASGFSWMR